MKNNKWLEISAVITGALYTVLITYSIVWCWLMAIISSSIFMFICYQRKIFAESALHLFYILIAFYGWYNWGKGIATPHLIGWEQNSLWFLLGTFTFLIVGFLLKKFSSTKLPFIDSFTTVFSVIATFMMIYAVTENWYYWLLIDTVSIYLYYKRKLYYATALFVAYDIIAINGLITWLNA